MEPDGLHESAIMTIQSACSVLAVVLGSSTLDSSLGCGNAATGSRAPWTRSLCPCRYKAAAGEAADVRGGGVPAGGDATSASPLLPLPLPNNPPRG